MIIQTSQRQTAYAHSKKKLSEFFLPKIIGADPGPSNSVNFVLFYFLLRINLVFVFFYFQSYTFVFTSIFYFYDIYVFIFIFIFIFIYFLVFIFFILILILILIFISIFILHFILYVRTYVDLIDVYLTSHPVCSMEEH